MRFFLFSSPSTHAIKVHIQYHFQPPIRTQYVYIPTYSNIVVERFTRMRHGVRRYAQKPFWKLAVLAREPAFALAFRPSFVRSPYEYRYVPLSFACTLYKYIHLPAFNAIAPPPPPLPQMAYICVITIMYNPPRVNNSVARKGTRGEERKRRDGRARDGCRGHIHQDANRYRYGE